MVLVKPACQRLIEQGQGMGLSYGLNIDRRRLSKEESVNHKRVGIECCAKETDPP